MKDLLKHSVFWIVVLVFWIAIGVSYFFLVTPKKAEADKLSKELEGLRKQGGNLANAKWHKVAEEYNLRVKKQEELCYQFIDKYKYYWDKPLREGAGRGFDIDVFRSIYVAEKEAFLRRARALIDVESETFSWPTLSDNASAEDAKNIQRYYWVQSELLDVIVAGKARQLLKLKIPQGIRSDDDPQPFQSFDFSAKVKLVYKDLPAFMDSLLRLDGKFLVFVDSLKFAKINDQLPTLRPGQQLEEPPIIVDRDGRIYLFHAPPHEGAEEGGAT